MPRKPAQPADQPMAAVVMAAGKGSRMGAKSLPKVCFPALGVPAINRSLASCRECGIETLVVVVGAGGEQVMETVSRERPGVLFACQVEPRGTGDAVRVGFEPLRRIGFKGLVWCVAGDKLVAPEAFRQVLAALRNAAPDGAFAVTDKPEALDMGVVCQRPDGRARGIFEQRDLRASEALAALDTELRAKRVPSPEDLRRRCVEAVGSDKRCARFFGPVWRLAQKTGVISAARLRHALPRNPGLFQVGDEWLSAGEIRANSPYKNESLYCFRSEALARGLRLMPRPPGGREDYFTDVVAALLHPARGEPADIRAVLIEDPTLMMGFNTPDQLLAIEDTLRRRGEGAAVRVRGSRLKLSRAVYRTAREWTRLFETFPPRLRRSLAETYGHDKTPLENRRRALLRLARRFARACGRDRKAVIVRAPGSLNLMGRHVDVLGGFVNLMPIDLEVMLMAAPRDDDVIRALPVEPGSDAAEFAVSREIRGLAWDDWLEFISSSKVREMVLAARTDWSSPIRAAVLRLQQQFRTRRLRGMDIVLFSDIPPAAGLDAAGALMVAASEACVLLNDLALEPEQMLSLCGEGKRYLDPTPGPRRHATAKLGERGRISRTRFHPFEVERSAPWPEGARMAMLAAPPDAARDSATETRRRMFAAMDLGLLLIKERYPQSGRLIEYVRDLNPQRLGAPVSEIYGMLLSVPPEVTRRQAARLVSAAGGDSLDRIFGDSEPSESLPVRDALLFGAAECARGDRCASLIERGDLDTLGLLMQVSHCAERVLPKGDAGRGSADHDLQGHIADLMSQDPERVLRGQLERRPGRFGVGSAVVDAMVGAAVETEGVYGAQLSGSALGGRAMALVRADRVQALSRRLRRRTPGARLRVLTPAAPAGVIRA